PEERGRASVAPYARRPTHVRAGCSFCGATYRSTTASEALELLVAGAQPQLDCRPHGLGPGDTGLPGAAVTSGTALEAGRPLEHYLMNQLGVHRRSKTPRRRETDRGPFPTDLVSLVR